MEAIRNVTWVPNINIRSLSCWDQLFDQTLPERARFPREYSHQHLSQSLLKESTRPIIQKVASFA
jgi:hypothetical protein